MSILNRLLGEPIEMEYLLVQEHTAVGFPEEKDHSAL